MNVVPLNTNSVSVPFSPVIDNHFIESINSSLSVSNVHLPSDNPHPSTNRVSVSRGPVPQSHLNFAYYILFELQHLLEGIPLQIAYFPVYPYDVKKRTKRKRHTLYEFPHLGIEGVPPRFARGKLKFS